jgi:hypothetical protein
VLLVALSSPDFRLRGRNGELLSERRPCLGCAALISAYAPASDRFCLLCAPLVDDEPPFDPALFCPKGHLRADFEVRRIDRSRGAGVKKECLACKRDRERERDRDRSRAALEELEQQRRRRRAA